MKYCAYCASDIIKKTPEDDFRQRYVCSSCQHVFYQNPLIVCACIVECGDEILLCRRGVDPQRNLWTMPGGFMEVGETTAEGAIRETQEETMANVAISRLHGIYDIPRSNRVYFIYRATLQAGGYSITKESSEVDLFTEDKIPWDEMAFDVVECSLRHYYRMRKGNVNYQVHTEVI